MEARLPSPWLFGAAPLGDGFIGDDFCYPCSGVFFFGVDGAGIAPVVILAFVKGQKDRPSIFGNLEISEGHEVIHCHVANDVTKFPVGVSVRDVAGEGIEKRWPCETVFRAERCDLGFGERLLSTLLNDLRETHRFRGVA
jgi:hypothetical protein